MKTRLTSKRVIYPSQSDYRPRRDEIHTAAVYSYIDENVTWEYEKAVLFLAL
jgi:hypothetical protein